MRVFENDKRKDTGSPSEEHQASLAEVHESVPIPKQPSFWRRLFAFAGPAYLVSVGYMDPGNWATDIAAGSKFGYALIWVLLMSNIMAVLLQSLSARLGIVTRMDLAQACRTMFSRRVSFILWVLAEIAIAACDVAEVLGSAIGLQLLFGIPLLIGVFVTALDTFVLLLLHSRGVRMMEAFIVALISTIGICLGVEIILSKPAIGPIVTGFVPALPGDGALYLAIGILGATVMPHNLYLHSALVQSRRITHTPTGIRSGVRFNILDSVVALNGAFFVNAALLVMAAATFYQSGLFNVADIQDAHRLLEPILGARIAPIAFAVALIASGQSSTITGTLAGQIVMEGFVRIRLRPLVRRMVTRGLAIIPAVVAIALYGEQGTGELLVLSQVVLSLQLSFAVIPLIHLVSDRRWMGQYAIGTWTAAASWLVAIVIAALNIKLAWDEVGGWLQLGGSWQWLVWATVFPCCLGLIALLAYVSVVPAVQRSRRIPIPESQGVHGTSAMPEIIPPRTPRRIAVTLDFTETDTAVLSQAVTIARATGRSARVILLHVVESTGARMLGAELSDAEAKFDQERLELYVNELSELGVDTIFDLGFGEPAEQLAILIGQYRPDLVIIGSHGHRGVGDLVHGTTVEALRHRVSIPLLVVPTRSAPPS